MILNIADIPSKYWQYIEVFMRPGSQPCLARPARSRLTRAVSPLVQDTTRAFTSVLELLHDDESFYRQRYYKALADNDVRHESA